MDMFLSDMLAGLTVGLTAIPQGIAYAVVAGLEPQVSPALEGERDHQFDSS